MAPRRLLSSVLALATVASVVRADEDPVVVKVGTATLGTAEVTRRFAGLPAFQLTALASSPDAAKRRFVDAVLVPELLYSQEAKAEHVEERPAVKRRIADALRRALVESIRKDTEAAGIPDAEVRAYYDAHLSDYHHDERLRLYRILVADEASAKKIIADVKGPGGPERWSALARDGSLDPATKLRAGALGFVQPDGRTDVPQLAVEPALYAAAAKVRDGEVVPEPVKEGNRFAVVWRRGTLPKMDRPFEVEKPAIVSLLVRERVDRTVKDLTAKLRAEHVKDEDPAPLAILPVEKATDAPAERKLGLMRPVNPVPSATDRGLR
ncbi:MAG TPA: peptidylprolyl isomerase [Polyangiaceae bacterium]|nr:peptidylprolyl isomerase [Polyangiaceae bacterium]